MFLLIRVMDGCMTIAFQVYFLLNQSFEMLEHPLPHAYMET